MGIVYLAEEVALDRLVALKVLPSAFVADPQSIERFRREARALARIHHPNIVQVHAIGETGDTLWFAMRFVEGEPLSAVIQAAATGSGSRYQDALGWTNPRSPHGDRAAFATQIGRQLALALGEVHAAGLVHRDVKPSNVLLDERGNPVLVDFGVACDPEAQRLTSDTTSPGTVRFMAPEQLQTAAAEPDPRGDIYALGVTLYEFLTLSPAFGQEELGSLIDAVVHGNFERPSRIESAVPRELEDVILCAMARDSENRFQTAREFADALGDASGHGPATMLCASTRIAPSARFHAIPRSAWIASAAILFGITAGIVFEATDSEPGPAPEAQVELVEQVDSAHQGFEVAEGSGPRPPDPAASGPPHPGFSTPTGSNPAGFGPPPEWEESSLPLLLVQFLASGDKTPLMQAAIAYRDNEAATCLQSLRSIEPPLAMPQRMIYFVLLGIVGDPDEITVAQQHVQRPPHKKGRKNGPFQRPPRGSGLFSKLGRRGGD